MHLVLCLVGLPLLPLDLGPARGVGVPLGLRLAWAGSLPLLLLLREEEERKLPAHRHPFPASPSLSTLPNSRRTFHDVRIRGSRQPLAPALCPPAIHALRGVDRGRIRGLGLERVALVDVAVALAPLPVRCQEGVTVGGGHRPRHALLVVAHAVSGRGLLTATALGVEALGRVVTGLAPRIDTGHAVTAPVVSVRVPLPVGGAARSFAIARSPGALAVKRASTCFSCPLADGRSRTTGQTGSPGGCGGSCLSASCGFWSVGGCYSCCRRDIHDSAPVCYAGACQVLFELVWLLFPGSNGRVCGCDHFCSSVGGVSRVPLRRLLERPQFVLRL